MTDMCISIGIYSLYIQLLQYYQNEATGVQYRSKKEVVDSATAESGILSTPQKTNKDDNGLSSNKKVDLVSSRSRFEHTYIFLWYVSFSP